MAQFGHVQQIANVAIQSLAFTEYGIQKAIAILL